MLLADEPTGNLDEATRDEVMEMLESRGRELGPTFVMVTHDSALARRADRVVRIADGRIETGGREEAEPAAQLPPKGLSTT